MPSFLAVVLNTFRDFLATPFLMAVLYTARASSAPWMNAFVEWVAGVTTPLIVMILFLLIYLDFNQGNTNVCAGVFVNRFQATDYVLKIGIIAAWMMSNPTTVVVVSTIRNLYTLLWMATECPFYQMRMNRLRAGIALWSVAVTFVKTSAFALPWPYPYAACALVQVLAFAAGQFLPLRRHHTTFGATDGTTLPPGVRTGRDVELLCRFVHDDDSEASVEKAHRLYILALAAFPLSGVLRLAYSTFIFTHMKTQVALVNRHLDNADAFDEKAFLYCVSKTKERITDAEHGENFHVFQRALKRARKRHQEALSRVLYFWKHVLSGESNALAAICEAIEIAADAAEKVYKNLLSRFPTSQTLLESYAHFLVTVRFDMEKAFALKQQFEEAEAGEHSVGESSTSNAGSTIPSFLVSDNETTGQPDVLVDRYQYEAHKSAMYRDKVKERLEKGAVKHFGRATRLLQVVFTVMALALTLHVLRSAEALRNNSHMIYHTASAARLSQQAVLGQVTNSTDANFSLSNVTRELYTSVQKLRSASLSGSLLHLLYDNSITARLGNGLEVSAPLIQVAEDFVRHATAFNETGRALEGRYLVENGLHGLWEGLDRALVMFSNDSDWGFWLFVVTDIALLVAAVVLAGIAWRWLIRAFHLLAPERMEALSLFIHIPKPAVIDLIRRSRVVYKAVDGDSDALGETGSTTRLDQFDRRAGMTVHIPGPNTPTLRTTPVSPSGSADGSKSGHSSQSRTPPPGIATVEREDTDEGGADELYLEMSSMSIMDALPKRVLWMRAAAVIFFALLAVQGVLLMASGEALTEQLSNTVHLSACVRRTQVLLHACPTTLGCVSKSNTSEIYQLLAAAAETYAAAHHKLLHPEVQHTHAMWNAISHLIHWAPSVFSAPAFLPAHNEPIREGSSRATLYFGLHAYLDFVHLGVHAPEDVIARLDEVDSLAAVLDAGLTRAARVLLVTVDDHRETLEKAETICVGAVVFFLLLTFYAVWGPLLAQINREGTRNLSLLFMIPSQVVNKTPAIRRFFSGSEHWRSDEVNEGEAKQTEKERDSMMEAAIDGILTASEEGVILSVNPALVSMFGFGAKMELVGEPIERLMPTEAAKHHGAYVRRYVASGVAHRIGMQTQQKAKKKDGTLFPVTVSLSTYKAESRRVFVAIFKDMTDIAAERERWHTAVTSTLDAFFTWQLEARENQDELWVSDRFSEIVGIRTREKPTTFAQLLSYVHKDDTQLFDMTLRRAISEPSKGYEVKVRIRHMNGSYLYVLSRGRVGKLDEKGHSVILAGAFTDVTEKDAERKRVEQALATERVNEQKQLFLAHMSHEIRTPLNGVIGISQLLLNDKKNLTPSQQYYADTIFNSSRQLVKIVNQILDFSKNDSGMLQVEIAPFEVKDVVETTFANVAVEACGKGVDLAYFLPPALPSKVMGDAKLIQQILLNLLTNAVKFTSKGSVVLNVEMKPGEAPNKVVLRFEVSDDGIGVDEADRHKLFEKFSQLDSSHKRKYGGTGLGLAICKQIVDKMGGVIDVDTNTHRDGATFFFTVPLTFDPEQSAPHPIEPPQNTRTLILYEDARIRSKLISALRAAHVDTSEMLALNQLPLELAAAQAHRAGVQTVCFMDEGANSRNLEWAQSAAGQQWLTSRDVRCVFIAYMMTWTAPKHSALREQQAWSITKPISAEKVLRALVDVAHSEWRLNGLNNFSSEDLPSLLASSGLDASGDTEVRTPGRNSAAGSSRGADTHPLPTPDGDRYRSDADSSRAGSVPPAAPRPSAVSVMEQRLREQRSVSQPPADTGRGVVSDSRAPPPTDRRISTQVGAEKSSRLPAADAVPRQPIESSGPLHATVGRTIVSSGASSVGSSGTHPGSEAHSHNSHHGSHHKRHSKPNRPPVDIGRPAANEPHTDPSATPHQQHHQHHHHHKHNHHHSKPPLGRPTDIREYDSTPNVAPALVYQVTTTSLADAAQSAPLPALVGLPEPSPTGQRSGYNRGDETSPRDRTGLRVSWEDMVRDETGVLRERSELLARRGTPTYPDRAFTQPVEKVSPLSNTFPLSPDSDYSSDTYSTTSASEPDSETVAATHAGILHDILDELRTSRDGTSAPLIPRHDGPSNDHEREARDPHPPLPETCRTQSRHPEGIPQGVLSAAQAQFMLRDALGEHGRPSGAHRSSAAQSPSPHTPGSNHSASASRLPHSLGGTPSQSTSAIGRHRAQPQPVAKAPGPAPDAPLILLVEDDQINALVAKALIEESLGYRVDHADNGAIAVEKFSTQHQEYSLILMDCQMPVMNGYDATKLIRQIEAKYSKGTGKRIPVVAFTAFTSEENIRGCYECGMDDVFGKPVLTENLMDIMQKWIVRYQYTRR